MTTTLLVLLVGELLAPFQADFRQALPAAFPEGTPEVGLGQRAPPGRTVAWVTVQGDGLEVEVVLHTARIPGDLRRVLRFTPEDAPKDRARAAAFTLAAMVRERDADLQALEPPALTAPVVPPPATPWLLDASLLAGFDLPGVHPGAGVGVGLRREVLPWLQLGAGVEVGLFATPATLLVQPSLFAEVAFALTRGRFSSDAVVGGGVAAPVLSRGGAEITTWFPLLRLALEGRLAVGAHHGLRFALSGHFVPSGLDIRVGQQAVGSVGPAWVRPEVGYFGEL